ncbi:hypothetical protein D9758_008219 [Tetrapyrgos nigripes]|uniref:glutathione transferase n=1 Tax=Tetrapyrgos nigripes TaxID=182062 RepID=A0A8H5G1E7_9AGAR|nr:hypothetical protein D9758_008219 [Tetrapyrgos nigripes]
MTITVHHLHNSRSQRILWLLEELGLPYEYKEYARDPVTQRSPPEYLKIHPLGKSPVITDGDITIAESGAIIEYIIKKYGNGKFAPSEAQYVEELYFTHYTEGSFMPVLVNKLIFIISPKQASWIMRPLLRLVFGGLIASFLNPEIKKHTDFLESHFKKNQGKFIAGGDDLTGADFNMIFALEMMVAMKLGDCGPATMEYLQKLRARPGFQKAIEKSGDTIAIPEIS